MGDSIFYGLFKIISENTKLKRIDDDIKISASPLGTSFDTNLKFIAAIPFRTIFAKTRLTHKYIYVSVYRIFSDYVCLSLLCNESCLTGEEPTAANTRASKGSISEK